MHDHNPASLKMLMDFCVDAVLYLAQNESHKIAVHCKAGKGRTGLAITCYLLFIGLFSDATEAMQCFGTIRSKQGSGLTIPSQKRFVNMFFMFLEERIGRPFVYNTLRMMGENGISNLIQHKTKFQVLALYMGPFRTNKSLTAKISIQSLDEGGQLVPLYDFEKSKMPYHLYKRMKSVY